MKAPNWCQAEDDLMRAHYMARGAKGMMELLPGRTQEAISRRAYVLEVKFGARAQADAQPNVLVPIPRMDDHEKLACIEFKTAFKDLDKTVNREQPMRWAA